jgi:16S rRNA (cytosine1402-N4)-methyltransferase
LTYPHRPVLLDEAVRMLVGDPGGLYVDGTVGTGGHSEAIADRIAGKGQLICLDQDPDAVQRSKERLKDWGAAVRIVQANYADLDTVLEAMGIKDVQGVFLDLGMSSLQIERSGRGFSFEKEEPLDMRMDPNRQITAKDIVNNFPLRDIETILRQFGEEKRARAIARAIGKARSERPIETSKQLAALMTSSFSSHHRFGARHPATKTFQALRIAVNHELENLDRFLERAPYLIGSGGRLVILSYHSLEDRRVKHAMMGWESRCSCPPGFPTCVCGKVVLFTRLNKRPIRPSPEEVAINPRARSAVLRAAERV